MDITNINNKKKSKTGIKILIILIISFIIVPLVIISLIYNTNKNFHAELNNILSKLPGSVGEHFRNYPTEIERNEKIIYLSNYFLNLDPSMASDKIYIIKKEDEKLYVKLIKEMNDISSKKTEEIVTKVRNTELRKDLLFSIYDDALKDEKEKFLQEVSRIEKQDILTTLLEVEKRFKDKEFLKVLNELKLDKLVEILYYTNIDYRDYIINSFTSNKRTTIEGMIFEKNNEMNTLVEIAKHYETKPIEVALKAIGNTENFSIDKLGIIYKNLSVSKSAELLSNIKDEKFIEELFASIIHEDNLIHNENNITNDINRAMEFYNEYNSKINDLVIIYEKMSPDNVAKIVEKMIINTDTITMLKFNTEEIMELSDSVIIIDVLSQMKNQTLAKVLDFMEPNMASQVTRLLAKPKN